MKALHPTAKTLLLLFIAAAVFYAISFFVIERRRHQLEPWSLTFSTNSTGAFQFQIDHQRLGITNVLIQFPDAKSLTNLSPATIRFERPRKVPFALPFGECVFMDTTFQPGTVVVRFEGHEIQMLPRVLTIDHREIAWQAGNIIPLPSRSNSPAEPAK